MTSVQVLPGPGLVARFGDVLLWMDWMDWMEEGDRGGTAIVVRLLELVRELADGAEGGDAGVRVAEVLRADPASVAGLVLVAPTGGGLRAVVHGRGRLLADGVDIDGGWIDRELEWTTTLAAGRSGDLLRVPTPGSVLDLRRGSTPGGGVAVALGARQAAAPAATPASSTTAPSGLAPASGGQELPVPGATGAALLPTTGVTVKGVVCSRGHFNHPVAQSCGTCGISMDQVSRILQDGTRPSLGSLVLDDGTAFDLEADHVVGGAPEGDPAVAAGEARPLAVVDPTGQVAPVHAEVRLVGWDVVLVARAPTFVLAPGAQQWTPAAPGQASPLPAGARVAVGQRTFVVEPDNRRSGP